MITQKKAENNMTRIINLPSIALISSVESELDSIFYKYGPDINHLEIDLSECKFIEIASLIHFSALLTDRSQKGLVTHIHLPKDKDVRDFIRTWEWPQAIRYATGIPFINFVSEEDHRFFGENPTPESQKYASYIYRDASIVRLLSDRFFSFTSFCPAREPSKWRIATDETNRWKKSLINSVLKRLLQDNHVFIASRVVFEAIMNAERHPNASVIQTASILTQSSHRASDIKNHLTIVFWDNGESIITTLKNAIQQRKCVRLLNFTHYSAPFLFVIEDVEGNETHREIISPDFVPDESTKDEKLLFSSLLPGVSCDTAGEMHLVNPDLRDDEYGLDAPGMGLYVLLNAVVDIMDGEVAFRTKNLFMNVKRLKKKIPHVEEQPHYRVKTKTATKYAPEFLGNMLTIRIPFVLNLEK